MDENEKRARETILLPDGNVLEMIRQLKKIYSKHGNIDIMVTGAYGSSDIINSLYVEESRGKKMLPFQQKRTIMIVRYSPVANTNR